jgi:acyl carrier protein
MQGKGRYKPSPQAHVPENCMSLPCGSFDVFVTLVSQIVSIHVEPGAITPETTLAGDLALDSISLISLLALTEERFGISFAEHADNVAQLRTVGEALALVEQLATAPV